MIIYVDIDETICSYADKKRHYPNAIPNYKNIEKVNNLFENGHTIIYWTARGTKTGLDWESVTKHQLSTWGAKHNELKLGKPFYDLFIDDRALNSIWDWSQQSVSKVLKI